MYQDLRHLKRSSLGLPEQIFLASEMYERIASKSSATHVFNPYGKLMSVHFSKGARYITNLVVLLFSLLEDSSRMVFNLDGHLPLPRDLKNVLNTYFPYFQIRIEKQK